LDQTVAGAFEHLQHLIVDALFPKFAVYFWRRKDGWRMSWKDAVGGLFAAVISGMYVLGAFAAFEAGDTLSAAFTMVVVVTSGWILFDAKSIGVRKGLVKGLGNLGPWGWYFGTALLWIVGFPLYLARRPQLKRALAEQTS